MVYMYIKFSVRDVMMDTMFSRANIEVSLILRPFQDPIKNWMDGGKA